MSIDNIVRRLRESRINEATKEFNYVFDIPWREVVSEDAFGVYAHDVYHYPGSMDYAEKIMSTAKEDFNDIDWSSYTNRDNRTEDCGILRMKMNFNNKDRCEITVTTSQVLGQDQIDNIIRYLEGQMSDGWGEGFEQRDIDHYTEENEEWIEDDEDEDGGYYETSDIDYYVHGQFWWADDYKYPYQIELVRTPDDINRPTKESLEESDEYKTLDDIINAPYSASFMRDRATINIQGKEYVKIGKNRWQYNSSQRSVLGGIYSDKEIFDKLSSKEVTESEDDPQQSYYVIDHTDAREGDAEKYKVSSREEAEKKKQELIEQGSDKNKIIISPIK
jgi:hypothetical protein